MHTCDSGMTYIQLMENLEGQQDYKISYNKDKEKYNFCMQLPCRQHCITTAWYANKIHMVP